MKTLEQIHKKLEDLKPYLKQRYAVSSLYIFGSYTRFEQTPQSDVDILVDFITVPDLLTFIEIEEFLSKELGIQVDLVPKRKLKKALKEHIMNEAIAI